LLTNSDSSGALTWTPEADLDLATVFVDLFRTDAHGSWRADLVGVGLPEFDGHELIRIELQSSLPRARVTLSAGADERWVSPVLHLSEAWQTHTLTLRSFEHQRLERRGWDRPRRSERRAPRDIDALTLTLGEPVNPVHASGWMRIRALSVE